MITNFDTYKLYEKAQHIDFELLYEKAKTSKTAYQHKTIVNRAIKDYKVNIYFATTFGTAITFFIPFIQQLIYNSDPNITLTAYEISLLIIFSIAEILNINDDSIKLMRKTLKEKGFSGLISKVKNSLLSLYKITSKVGESIGRTIEKFIEMFAYVNIFIPIWQVLVEVTQQEGFNIDTLPKKILGLTIGAGAFYLKNLIKTLLDKLSMRMSWQDKNDLDKFTTKQKDVEQHQKFTKNFDK